MKKLDCCQNAADIVSYLQQLSKQLYPQLRFASEQLLVGFVVMINKRFLSMLLNHIVVSSPVDDHRELFSSTKYKIDSDPSIVLDQEPVNIGQSVGLGRKK
ncbi:hypothetical protein CU098_006280 [Rhizopus stolonifer]|uniref:Uncharacterized protein n=1 Tax=Rhizopus stolonifer TaxID=4846 RepID=A0A367INX2_RHIST|nr:hypothetical protein CU098_006280 [Rhizopus stolonifer]